MALTNLTFIYIFLPLCLFLFYAVPVRARPGTLLGISLLYYLLAQPGVFWIMAASVLLDYLACRAMDALDAYPEARRGCMIFCFVKNLGLILWVNALVEIYGAPARLGLLIYTLTGLDMALAVYRREMGCERNMFKFGLHCCFFAKLYAGPLTAYPQVAGQFDDMRLRPAGLLAGAGQFVHGAIKSLVLGGTVTVLYQSIREIAPENISILSSWLLVVALAFSVYFTLSGFCDMAKGIAAMFGIEIPRNFYYPYQSRSVTDFFSRFNITVNQFFRRTAYRSLQEDKFGFAADALNILVIGMLMGLWFGFRINCLLWGVYLAAFIVMEKYLYPKVLAAVPTLFRRFYTICVVLSSFMILAGSTAAHSAKLIRDMFGVGRIPLSNEEVLYLLSSNWLLLILCAFFSTSVIHLASNFVRKKWPRIGAGVMACLDAGVLLVFTALSL